MWWTILNDWKFSGSLTISARYSHPVYGEWNFDWDNFSSFLWGSCFVKSARQNSPNFMNYNNLPYGVAASRSGKIPNICPSWPQFQSQTRENQHFYLCQSNSDTKKYLFCFTLCPQSLSIIYLLCLLFFVA